MTVLAGYAALAALLGPGRLDDAPVLCPFRALTGRPCPACGLTRSVARTLRGDVAGAVAAHRLGPALVAGLALLLPGHLPVPAMGHRWHLTPVMAHRRAVA